jgi:phosphopantothenoylcysteine decarboxylase/phosphopantothenate--cysteine ligase
MKATGQTLEKRLVVLGITGSVAAVEDVRLARALRRRGAGVQAVMTEAACGIVHPDAITYATERPALTRVGGLVEHVTHCGIGGCADLLLIAPCTANSICKIAAGIDDTPVTTFATTAIGRGMPVIIVPAMHESMFNHPAVRDALEKLRDWGIGIVGPRFDENKAKFADIEDIVLAVERELMDRPLAGKRVLITSGACAEPIDDVRVMTTRSSGRMGREIAMQAHRLGADVTVVHSGRFPAVENVHAESAAGMRSAVLELLSDRKFDYYVSAAAISDFSPRRAEGKIPSGSGITLTLDPQPKLLAEVLEGHDLITIAFKLGWDEEQKAEALLDEGAAMVVVNTPDVMGAEEGRFLLLTGESRREVMGTKEEVARALWSAVQ